MKTNHLFLFLCVTFVFISCNSKQTTSKETKVISYLGQEPPKLKPKLFAPHIISTDSSLEINVAISSDKNEFYFTRQIEGERPKNLGFKFENDTRKQFMEEPYSGETVLSTDGKTMHLGNKFRERIGNKWSDEKSMDFPYKDINIMRLSSSNTGTYIFDERDTIGTLRISKIKNDHHQQPEVLEGIFKEGTYIGHPFIAPDESYIIWDCNKEGGYGDSDLYVSFKQKDGSWGEAINLGKEINSEFEDAYGSISADGKYFFFHRIKLGETFDDSFANIYWVDAKTIMNLKNELEH